MKLIYNFLFIFSLIFLTSCTNKNADILNLLFFDVNQGDSSFVEYKDITLLIATGYSSFSNNVVDILKGKKIREIDYVILSHDHDDHVSGFENIYNNFKIKNLILPGVLQEETFNDIESMVNNSNTKIHYIKNPSTINLYKDFSLNFLSNLNENPKEFNDSSLVFKASIKDFDILYTGDIEEEGQINILNQNIQSEILKVPHHGAYNNDKNNLDKFIAKVSPFISVISVGDNSYGHPNKNTLNLLNNINSKILRTDELGNILIKCDFKNNSLSINSFI